ncbi:dihydroorotase [Lacticaseibacillus brantae]|uniref:Dihydroorotase n=1 Tax=Lacticaseibacillus brantae DSM 23927 TaxID=1423727 RepID=A0A0R2AZU0_9LACO|nr:dihydroorotase [Lacticaseibacillus brantae]KRM72647.1 dihydroorotase [Lacticaseibacillus brantae DSM 23927]
MTVLIKQARVLGKECRQDIRIADGVVTQMAPTIPDTSADTIIEANGAWALPGLIDVHVHFREPGFTDKETIATGSVAAAHGGFTQVVAMPNLNPVPETLATTESLLAKNQQDGHVRIHQFAAMTTGLTSDTVVDMVALKKAGVLGFSNDGKGVQSAATMLAAMSAAQAIDAPIAAHIEDESLVNGGVINAGPIADKLHLPGIPTVSESSQLARDLQLAQATGVHYHACHVSTKASVDLIRWAKAAGIRVTAEVSPHHLLLDDTMIPGDNPNYKMNPPLRSPDDRAAVLAGLLDGTIDMVATDHAPHTAAQKTGSFSTAAFGIVGLETAFSLLYTHLVKSGVMPFAQLVQVMSRNPATAFGLSGGQLAVGEPADLTIMETNQPYPIDPATWFSKGHNSPFIGETVYGTTLATIVGGHIAYHKGE